MKCHGVCVNLVGKPAYSLCTPPEPAQTCLVQSSWQDLVRSGHLYKAELNSTTSGCTLCSLQQGVRLMLYSSVNTLATGESQNVYTWRCQAGRPNSHMDGGLSGRRRCRSMQRDMKQLQLQDLESHRLLVHCRDCGGLHHWEGPAQL